MTLISFTTKITKDTKGSDIGEPKLRALRIADKGNRNAVAPQIGTLNPLRSLRSNLLSFVLFVSSFENTRLGMRTKRPAWVPSYPRKRVSRLIRRNKPGFPPWSFVPYSTGRE